MSRRLLQLGWKNLDAVIESIICQVTLGLFKAQRIHGDVQEEYIRKIITVGISTHHGETKEMILEFFHSSTVKRTLKVSSTTHLAMKGLSSWVLRENNSEIKYRVATVWKDVLCLIAPFKTTDNNSIILQANKVVRKLLH